MGWVILFVIGYLAMKDKYLNAYYWLEVTFTSDDCEYSVYGFASQLAI